MISERMREFVCTLVISDCVSKSGRGRKKQNRYLKFHKILLTVIVTILSNDYAYDRSSSPVRLR